MRKLLFAICVLTNSCLAAQIILAPDTLSTRDPEFAITFSPNGKSVLFNRTSPDRNHVFLMESNKTGAGWGTPQIVRFSDTAYREMDPFITHDGNRLLFTSNRPVNGSTDFNIWVTNRVNGEWGMPAPISDAINNSGDEMYSTVTVNGTVYFSRTVGGKSKIFKSELKNGEYRSAVQVNIAVPDSVGLSNPCISPDEKWLIFVSSEMRGLGGADLYICGLAPDSSWSTPSNLTLINSKYGDFAPAFSHDGRFLYYTSEQPGVVKNFPEGKRRPGDLYQISWINILMNFGKRY